MKNRALAAAYAGAGRFGLEIFEPRHSNAIMAALLVHDLRNPASSANPASRSCAPDAALRRGLLPRRPVALGVRAPDQSWASPQSSGCSSAAPGREAGRPNGLVTARGVRAWARAVLAQRAGAGPRRAPEQGCPNKHSSDQPRSAHPLRIPSSSGLPVTRSATARTSVGGSPMATPTPAKASISRSL